MKKSNKSTGKKKTQTKLPSKKLSDNTPLDIEPNVKTIKGMFDIKGVWNTLQLKTKPHKKMLVHMQLYNKSVVSFYVLLKENHFAYNNCEYLIDTEFMYFSPTFQSYCIDFHEGITTALKRDYNPDEIKGVLKDSDIAHALNPKNVKLFMKSQFIEKVQQGEALTKMLKFMQTLLVLILVASVGMLIMFLDYSGYLNNII